MDMPSQKYDIIVADPPWHFSSNSPEKPGRNAMRHYACMSDAEIAALPIGDLAAAKAMLFLWTTPPMIERSLDVQRSWGFRYVTQIVWVKERVGTGYWVRGRHEIVLLCKRGNFPCPRPAPFKDSVITGGLREHSRKPDELQAMIDSIWPDASKLEMFARQTRLGWASTGNEVGKFG